MTSNISALETSRRFFPGGVNSPVRAFAAVGGNPLFIARGVGANVIDIEGRTFIDYIGSWGPLILGHTDPDVITAVTTAAAKGLTFGAPTLAETELAKLIKDAFPYIERMRFVSSGTEATMSAIRLARGYTNRKLIVKCDGCYHGHGDSLLVSAGSGVATLGIPGCPGITPETASGTLTVPFNDLRAVEEIFETHGTNIAAMIIEPVCGNIGVVLPEKDYLQALRHITRQHNALLIFDEVMTGFRTVFGGMGTIEDVTPDLTCLGKIVGGGMPLAVYGGRDDIMAKIAPEGPVYQAGTLSGNPVAVAAGTATLRKLKSDRDFYKLLTRATEKLCSGLNAAAKKNNVRCRINRFGSMFTIFFTHEEVKDYQTAKSSDTKKFAKWFRAMLGNGIYLPPSQFEAAFVSIAHGEAEITATIAAAEKAFASF